jgi:hypothetical protein
VRSHTWPSGVLTPRQQSATTPSPARKPRQTARTSTILTQTMVLILLFSRCCRRSNNGLVGVERKV